MTPARIEIRHVRNGEFVATILDAGLRQATFAYRDDAIYAAMQWCVDLWSRGREVGIAEYGPHPLSPRWSAEGLRSLDDLRDYVEGVRDACTLAERAIERTVT